VAADILLVVEVADTSLQYDRRIKVPLYARHGITEVWIVEIERDRVRAYREPTTTGYRIAQELSRRATVAPQALQQCAIDLDAVLAR
jgi:Uma2 family endonuclease